ncbi:hypothetical protein [Pseudomonas indica]|uniref:Uncharacterized protein n=1 Tax=Pseudomonas indica TaxID=137658 RepID=A0A1G8V1E5_9PSED|nr:hypothetical protein [Pseudomonas indica]SDJ59926.1 hypothetical protein SAMN05216186_10267 [Pseudomonas indica]
MKDQTLDQAIIEAARFIQAAKQLRTARRATGYDFGSLPRESGLARRASMDLTRKLADLRQGR